MIIRTFLFAPLVFFHILITPVSAEEVRVAVAANFTSTLQEIALQFEREQGHTILISSGSSGKFYAQIKHGAPFDVFFSADVIRPKMMEEEGLAVSGSRFTYAIGRLTLWSPDPNILKDDGPMVLSKGRFTHLAIANPKTAPYGTAAKQVLEKLGLWHQLKDRIVQGENIGQTFQFVFSHNAQLGFVALAQVLDSKINGVGSQWKVPEHLHEPLAQHAVLLTNGQHNAAALAFLDFVKGPNARAIIERFGYGLE
jgi:molybdate transport system substrate-binding protein